MAVEREAYDAAWERTFSQRGVVEPRSGVVPPLEYSIEYRGFPTSLENIAPAPEKPLFSVDPCDVAAVLEPTPTEWRRA